MEKALVKILSKFEQSFVDYVEGESSSYRFKSGYLDMKYDIVRLFLQATEEVIDFDFEKFVEEQKSLPLLRNEIIKGEKQECHTRPNESI